MEKLLPRGQARWSQGNSSPRGIRGLILGTEGTLGSHCLSLRQASLSPALSGHSECLRCCHGIRFCIVCVQGIHFVTEASISLDLPVLPFTLSPQNNSLQNGDCSIHNSAQCQLGVSGLQGSCWRDAVRSESVTGCEPVCVPHGVHRGIFDWGYRCQRDISHRDHDRSFPDVRLLSLSPRLC